MVWARVTSAQALLQVVAELAKHPGVVDQRDGRRDTPLGTARRRLCAARPGSELAAALQRVEEALLAAGSNSELASFTDARSSMKQPDAAGLEGSYQSWDRQQELEWRHAAERGRGRGRRGRARRGGGSPLMAVAKAINAPGSKGLSCDM